MLYGCFDCVRLMFWPSWPMFWLSRPKVDMFRLCAWLKIASRPPNSVAKLRLLDFQSRRINQAPRPGLVYLNSFSKPCVICVLIRFLKQDFQSSNMFCPNYWMKSTREKRYSIGFFPVSKIKERGWIKEHGGLQLIQRQNTAALCYKTIKGQNSACNW